MPDKEGVKVIILKVNDAKMGQTIKPVKEVKDNG